MLTTPEIDWTNIPSQFWGKVSAVCRSYSDCLDLNHWFGDEDFEPDLPILLVIPSPTGPHYGQVCGMGLAPVYEMRDECVARWEITENRLARTGNIVDFDVLREKAGLVERSKVDEAFRTALTDRIAAHKASPVTDPPRQPRYPNPTNRVVFAEHVPYGDLEGTQGEGSNSAVVESPQGTPTNRGNPSGEEG